MQISYILNKGPTLYCTQPYYFICFVLNGPFLFKLESVLKWSAKDLILNLFSKVPSLRELHKLRVSVNTNLSSIVSLVFLLSHWFLSNSGKRCCDYPHNDPGAWRIIQNANFQAEWESWQERRLQSIRCWTQALKTRSRPAQSSGYLEADLLKGSLLLRVKPAKDSKHPVTTDEELQGTTATLIS